MTGMPDAVAVTGERPSLSSLWSRLFLVAGALLGLLTVAMGALAAHLPERLLAPGGRELLRSAVQMQGWHTVALLACGLLAERREPGHLPATASFRPAPRAAGAALAAAGLAFLVGIACFTSGLYALAFAGGSAWARTLGHAAPVGGSVLMLGWLLLAVACLLRTRR